MSSHSYVDPIEAQPENERLMPENPKAHERGLRRYFWAAAAVLPFLLIYWIHKHCLGNAATGFVQGDQAYYLANARAIFARGNGVFYPNPFDASRSAPVIYFQWPIWLAGVTLALLAIDPGILYVALGVVASFALAVLTWRLVELRTRDERLRPWVFLFIMWGGGLLSLAGLLSPLGDPFLFDPAEGFWFQNWGRNAIFSLESLYHALMAAFWIALLSSRWRWALLFAVLVLGAHPFTGVILIAGATPWLAVSFRDRVPAWFYAGMAAAAAAFCAYYFLYLPSFPEHAAIVAQWALAWNLSLFQNFLALGPVAILATVTLLRTPRPWGRGEKLFLCFFGASFLLSNHQWFMKPIQPLHFTRGYPWIALALLGAPTLERILHALRRISGSAFVGVAGALLAFSALDNAGFLLQNAETCPEHIDLAPDARALLKRAAADGLKGTFFSPITNVNLLAPTYSKLTPYYSHPYLTPHGEEREAKILSTLASNRPAAWLGEIDFVLLDTRTRSGWMEPRGWAELYRSGSWAMFQNKMRNQ
jgi:hypothetical protein